VRCFPLGLVSLRSEVKLDDGEKRHVFLGDGTFICNRFLKLTQKSFRSGGLGRSLYHLFEPCVCVCVSLKSKRIAGRHKPPCNQSDQHVIVCQWISELRLICIFIEPRILNDVELHQDILRHEDRKKL